MIEFNDENRSAVGRYEGVDPPQRQGPERACYDDKDNEQHQHDAKREPPLSDAGRQVGEHKLMRHARDLRRLLPARRRERPRDRSTSERG